MVYANFLTRFAAFVIDAVILTIPGVILGQYIPYPVTIFIAVLYRPMFESSMLRGSPGKLILGLNVVSLDGGRITFKAALIRYIMSYVSGALLGIGYLMALFTERKQALHDIVAQTLVVKTQEEAPTTDWFRAWLDQVKTVLNLETQPVASQGPTGAGLSALEQLHKLHQQGILTEEEYLLKKAEILNKI